MSAIVELGGLDGHRGTCWSGLGVRNRSGTWRFRVVELDDPGMGLGGLNESKDRTMARFSSSPTSMMKNEARAGSRSSKQGLAGPRRRCRDSGRRDLAAAAGPGGVAGAWTRGSGDAGEAREARVGRIRARKALDGRGATDPGDGAVVKLQSHGGLHRFPVQNETERKRVENGEGEEGRERKGSTRVLLVLRQWRAGDGRTEARAVLLPLRGRGQGRETARRPCSGMSRGAWEAAKGTGLGAPRVLCSGEVVGMVEEELLSFGFERGREEETPGQEAARDRVEALVGPMKKTREVGGAVDGWI